MLVLSKIVWIDGNATERVVDFDNPAERKRFACVSRAALERGASVTTVAVDRVHVEDI